MFELEKSKSKKLFQSFQKLLGDKPEPSIRAVQVEEIYLAEPANWHLFLKILLLYLDDPSNERISEIKLRSNSKQ